MRSMTWQYVPGPNVGSQSGGGESDRPVRWRPGDLVPKRLRSGGEYSVWKAAVNPFAPSGGGRAAAARPDPLPVGPLQI